jgi:hypothetical protein
MKGKNFMSRKFLNSKNVRGIEIPGIFLRAKWEGTKT